MSATRTQLNQGLDAIPAVLGPFLALGHNSTPKGSSVTLAVTYNPGLGVVSALQFDAIFTGNLVFQSAAIGPAGTTAGKGLVFNAGTGGVRFVIAGLNQTAIGKGILATLTFGTLATAPLGPICVGIANVIASTPTGVDAVIPGATGTVTLL